MDKNNILIALVIFDPILAFRGINDRKYVFILSFILSFLSLLNDLYRCYARNSRNNTSNARINSFSQGRGIIRDVIQKSTVTHEFQRGIYQCNRFTKGR